MEPFAEAAAQYRDFAEHAHGESPCFEDWARRVADDDEVLGWLTGLPPVKQQPNLVFAAARWHGVPAPGPYDGLREALLGDDGTIRATIMSRFTQTNEVGRLATLVPVLGRIQEESGRPLALIEVGASAGLCLLPDRFDYEWRTASGAVRLGDGVGPTLTCDVSGDAALPDRLPRVLWRGGLDLNPIDVTDPDATAWLTNLVWPEQDDRRRLLGEAVNIARTDPPRLVRGNLLTDLPPLLDEAGSQGQVVVFHSAVIAYLAPDDRERFHRMMAGFVRHGACRWVSNEAPGVLPGLIPAGGVPAGRFVMAVDGRAVAWTHGHGRSMTWL